MNDLLNRIDNMPGPEFLVLYAVGEMKSHGWRSFTCCSKAIWKCPNPCWNERLSNHQSQFISSEDFHDKFNFP